MGKQEAVGIIQVKDKSRGGSDKGNRGVVRIGCVLKVEPT